jgi:hypothetical protein
MSDIVERLRAEADEYIGDDGALCREAADEIARLRSRVAELEKALQGVVSDVLEYERINNLSPSPGREYCWDSIATAHAALDPATSYVRGSA